MVEWRARAQAAAFQRLLRHDTCIKKGGNMVSHVDYLDTNEAAQALYNPPITFTHRFHMTRNGSVRNTAWREKQWHMCLRRSIKWEIECQNVGEKNKSRQTVQFLGENVPVCVLFFLGGGLRPSVAGPSRVVRTRHSIYLFDRIKDVLYSIEYKTSCL